MFFVVVFIGWFALVCLFCFVLLLCVGLLPGLDRVLVCWLVGLCFGSMFAYVLLALLVCLFLYVCSSVRPVAPSFVLFVCLLVGLFVVFVSLCFAFVCLFVCMFVCLFVSCFSLCVLFLVCLFVCLSVCLSVCSLFVCLFVCSWRDLT